MENDVKINESQQNFSDEMRTKILEAEEYMGKHPDEWVASSDLFDSMKKI